MTIFGTSEIDGHRIHNATGGDTIANYSYGTILIISVILAVCLNPIVFYYNWKKKLTLATGLFQLLSFIDFIYSYRTLSTIYELLKPTQSALCEEPKTLQQDVYWKFQTLFGHTVGYSSMFVTLSLGAVRYVNIKFPYWSLINRREISIATVALVAGDFTSNVLISLFYYYRKSIKYAWLSLYQGVVGLNDDKAELELYFFKLIPFYVKIGFAVIFSALTVHALRTEQGQIISNEKKRGVQMIILLNLGNIFWCILCIFTNIATRFRLLDYIRGRVAYSELRYWLFHYTFLGSVAMQSILAAYNPLIICLRSTGINLLFKQAWKKVKKDVLKSSSDVAVNCNST